MTDHVHAMACATCFEPADASGPALPIWIIRQGQPIDELAALPAEHRAWLKSQGFTGQPKRVVLLPGPDGMPAGAVLGAGDGEAGEPCGPSELLAGVLPSALSAGVWTIANRTADAELAAVAWGLGAYRFRRYKAGEPLPGPVLRLSGSATLDRVLPVVDGVWQARDLINTPANDMGPAELEAAARAIAGAHGVSCSVIAATICWPRASGCCTRSAAPVSGRRG